MSDVARFASNIGGPGDWTHSIETVASERWIVHHDGRTQAVLPPAALPVVLAATSPGADNDAVRSSLA
jgi:hypothetical protein